MTQNIFYKFKPASYEPSNFTELWQANQPKDAIEAQSDGEMKKFENSKMGLSFQYPSEWNLTSSEPELCEDNACTVTFISENLTTHELAPFLVMVQANKLNGSALSNQFCNCNSLEDFIKYKYNRYWKKFTFINDNQTTIQDNRSAWQIELISDSEKTRFFDVLTINNGYGYLFVYSADDNSRFDTHLQDFKNMINSVVFNSTTSKKIPSFMKNNDTADQSHLALTTRK